MGPTWDLRGLAPRAHSNPILGFDLTTGQQWAGGAHVGFKWASPSQRKSHGPTLGRARYLGNCMDAANRLLIYGPEVEWRRGQVKSGGGWVLYKKIGGKKGGGARNTFRV